MSKIILHQILIGKSDTKRSFQIRLPNGICKVEGILVSCTIGTIDQLAGSLWLRIPEQRDVFYNELVHTNPHEQKSMDWKTDSILSLQPEKWFSATKQKFFKIDVPIENTIIEGFYKDESQQDFIKYQVSIYLQLKVNAKHSPKTVNKS